MATSSSYLDGELCIQIVKLGAKEENTVEHQNIVEYSEKFEPTTTKDVSKWQTFAVISCNEGGKVKYISKYLLYKIIKFILLSLITVHTWTEIL